ncbi:DsrE family protein [Sphingobacterium zeae]|uniref:Intracellular sulfur oxidation DsrE/DsrF family protein n=1 Tax=Sphingobacterium zeae TaxID=1776859 RepID=A0ABU0UBL2_9SPHI|nr:DsrE family protein [Sphingobacterium zeae]MDQ1152251.1 intracellular sulfur oxidation DsrE/DsrF family protein [Sphingobacterium zeae]
MKKQFTIACILLAIMTIQAKAQDNKLLLDNHQYSGAVAKKKAYIAIYQLDSNDPKTIEKAIRNINNVLKDPRLKGRLQIELVAFSGGTEAFLKKNSQYEKPLKNLVEKGVIVAQCLNTLEERHIAKEELFDFIGYVPSGNGELILRANEGWVIIKP